MRTKHFAIYALAGVVAAGVAGCSEDGGSVTFIEGDSIAGDQNNTNNTNSGNDGGDETPFEPDADALGTGLPAESNRGTNADGGDFVVAPNDPNVADAAINGTLVGNYTLTADRVWEIRDGVFIGEDAGFDGLAGARTAVLTIEAGTKIIANGRTDVLVVSRGSRIEANGTAAAPIQFTIPNEQAATNPRGRWGGIVINGNAPINACDDGDGILTADEAECSAAGEGSSGLYGGTIADDNSGTLRYVLVKHAGIQLTTQDELNGIAFQGVGSGTTVDYLQIHNNQDDGVEFFGGTVNVKHLVLTGIGDDSLDWTQGWTGNIQFMYVKQADDAGDRGIEADNLEGAEDNLPRSLPTIYNATFVGPDNRNEAQDAGMVLRRGTGVNMGNIVVEGFFDSCIDIDSDTTFENGAGGAMGTAANAQAGDQLTMINSIVNGCTGGSDQMGGTASGNFEDEDGDQFLVSAWFEAGTGNSEVDPQLNALGIPAAGSPALTGAAADPTAAGSFFEAADYIGAFDGSTDWRSGWAVDVDNNPIQ